MQGKFLGFVVIAIGCLIGYGVLTQQRNGPPMSTKVNDEAFYLLKPLMSYHEVVGVLGEPLESTTGRIVKLRDESPYGQAAVKYGLQEERHSVDRLFLFRGVNDENVRALFSSGRLAAAEYRLGDARMLYVGPPSLQSERVLEISSIRLSDELLQRIDAFRRKQSLRQQRLGEAKQVAGGVLPPRVSPPTPPRPVVVTTAGSRPPHDGVAALPPAAASRSGWRAWASADGAHTTEARCIGASGGVARLQKKDGSIVDVPKSKLCDGDWSWIRENRHSLVRADFRSIWLPSGAILRGDAIEPPSGWRDSLLSTNSLVGYFDGAQNAGDSGQAISVIANRRGDKLDGPAVSFYKDGHLQTIAEYRAGQLFGALRIWEENKDRLLYSEYNRGKRHGITCLFHDGFPWIVHEYERGSAVTEYYVDLKSGTLKLVPQDVLVIPDEKLDYADALEKLADLDGVLQQGEEQLRKAVQDELKAMVAMVRARQREGANARLMGRKLQGDADWNANAAAALANSGF